VNVNFVINFHGFFHDFRGFARVTTDILF